MGLFKPMYLNLKKPYQKRLTAIQNEKSKQNLKKAALNAQLEDSLRAIAIKESKDADVCEAVLMSYSAKYPTSTPDKYGISRYYSAAETLSDLGEQQRLENVFRQTTYHAVRAIVISHILNPVLLEDAAINEGEKYGPQYLKVSENAIAQIKDEPLLARIAIHSSSGYGAEAAVKRISNEDLLRDIVLQSKIIGVRVEALNKLHDASSLIEPLKKELVPIITQAPLDSYWQIQLLALTGDKTGRILRLCTETSPQKLKELAVNTDINEALEADADILYPVLKKLSESLIAESNSKTEKLLPLIAKCIKLLHDNGIKRSQIEAELPQTVKYHYSYTDYAGDDYDSAYQAERNGEISFR